MDPLGGGVGVGGGSTPQTGIQVQVGGCWGEKKAEE